MARIPSPMTITQEMVTAAAEFGFSMHDIALYEERRPTEIFLHPNSGARKIFSRWLMGKRVYLEHGDFPRLLAEMKS